MVCTCGSAGVIRDIKKVLHLLELDLKVFVRCPMWVLGSEFVSSVKTVSTCNPQAISQSPRCESLPHYLTCSIPSTNESSHLSDNSRSYWKPVLANLVPRIGNRELGAAE